MTGLAAPSRDERSGKARSQADDAKAPSVRSKGELPSDSPASPELKLPSVTRLKATFAVFLVAVILALSALIVFLVTRIFSELTPSMRAELEWKTQRGATELAGLAELGLALGEADVVHKDIAVYEHTPDIVAIVAVDAAGKQIAVHGKPPETVAQTFSGQPEIVRTGERYLTAWAPSVIEGREVGKMALYVSTARLEAGERLRRNLLGAGAMGCLVALGASLFFVGFKITPLINITQQSLRRAREMELARKVQTSILPRRIDVEALRLSAAMLPAEDVGGDYYDVIPFPGGCWIGIGDVAGHGLQAGLIMLMVQSAVASLTKQNPHAGPNEVLDVVNRVLYENIRGRMQTDDHITFSLMRFERDGRFVFAGAHEEIIVYRAAKKCCERVETPGTWLGAFANVKHAMVETELRLEPGDLLVLYTDGVTEARSAEGEFGVDRLAALVEKHATAPVDEIQRTILDEVLAFMVKQDDDVTVMVMRYTGLAA